MDRIERKRAELEKLYQYRAAAMRRNDFLWLSANQQKIDSIEKEIIELEKNRHATVFSVLSQKDEMTKNGVYKALLRISLLADACNEAAVIARDLLAEHGITDFSFRNKVKELSQLSHDIAGITLVPNRSILENFITDDEKFVDMCIKHADAHIKRKLKL